MAENLVKFVATTAAAFSGAATAGSLNSNTLYFVSDERRIYKGAVPYSGGIYKEVTALPDTLDINVLYHVTSTGEVAYSNGTSKVTLVAPYSTSLGEGSTNNQLATAKSVVDYVDKKVSDLSVGNLSAQVEKNKTDIAGLTASVNTLTGEGEGSVKKALSDAKGYTDTAKAALQGEIDKKANSATTLAGYGIGDAYTKTQTDNKITEAVANAHHLKREIVKTLPAVSDANADTIYMVPTSGSTDTAGSQSSAYIEYMLINGGFERIGTSDVDLTNYATKDEVSTAKSDAATDATTKANKALEDAKTYANGLASNYATATQGAKADTALQKADIVEGTTAGAISVKGTAVKVHGLGSAAYVGTGTFATAAQGGKADTALQAADITESAVKGQISVKGTDVAIHGLGSAAYANTSAFDSAGAASTALTSAKSYADGLASNYATAAQGTNADTAIQQLTWGTL